MSGYQADAVVEAMEHAMNELGEAMRGIPIRWAEFKGYHDKAARSVANLTTALTDARLMLGGDVKKARATRSRRS